MLLSVLLSSVIFAILFIIRHRKQTKTGLKMKEKEEAQNIFLSLACEDDPMDFFVTLAHKKHENVVKNKNYIVIKHNVVEEKEGTKKSKTVSTILFADFSFEGLNIARFMEIYGKVKKEKATKIVIVCKTIADKQIFSFCNNFDEKFLIFDEFETYQKLYKFYDCFPQITKKYKAEKRLALKDFVAFSFNKKRTKGYLFSAFILILSGLFIRATIYYCIIASLLVVFALVSQFNPFFNTKPEAEIL